MGYRYGYGYDSSSILIYLLVYIFVGIGVACIFGAITKGINESKGYYGGFAWGFWLGWIGIIVVACRQPNQYVPKESIIVPAKNVNQPPHAFNAQPTLTPDGWRCSCGRVNARYISSCACGINKNEAITKAVTPTPQPVATAPVSPVRPVAPAASIAQASTPMTAEDEFKIISALKEYKALLDSGVITQEEFDAKKKAILSK